MLCSLKPVCYFFLILQSLMGIAAVAGELTYDNVGAAPSSEQIKSWDISIGPEGKELPPGKGTAREGEKIYNQKCAYCHGPAGSGGPAIRLAVPPVKRGGLSTWGYQGVTGWPYATSIWDYINRAMPVTAPGTLTADEVYSLTAYLLNVSGIIEDDTVLNSDTLPAIEMPARNDFFPKPKNLKWDPEDHRQYGIYDLYPEDNK